MHVQHGKHRGTGSHNSGMRWIAIDWSGRLSGAANHIWTAVADAERVHELRAGRTREQLTAWLIAEKERDPGFVVGIDFAFGLPAWFCDEHGLAGAPDLWAFATKAVVTDWLTDCPPPFWGKPGRPRPKDLDGLRETDRLVRRAKSVFQIGGAGAVGTGSLRGWETLVALRQAGFSIWPFEESHRLPLVVEVYPRACTGPVRKSDWRERRRWVDRVSPGLRSDLRDPIIASEDALDAFATALAMSRAKVSDPGAPSHPLAAREGWIWLPPDSAPP